MVFISLFTGLFLVLWGVCIFLAPLLLGAIGFVANRTAKFRFKDYVPVVVLLAVTLAISAFAGDALLDLVEALHRESPALRSADADAHAWAETERSPGATTFFTAVTVIGTPAGMGVIVTIVTVILVVKKRFRWAAYLVFTSVTGSLIVLWLKQSFARQRPDLSIALRNAHGYSFPSGHAMGSTIVCGALAYLAWRAIPDLKWKAAAMAFLTTFVLAVSLSRIYLGVHWISDVGAGLAAGLLWVTGSTVAYETFRRIRLIRALREKRAVSSESA